MFNGAIDSNLRPVWRLTSMAALLAAAVVPAEAQIREAFIPTVSTIDYTPADYTPADYTSADAVSHACETPHNRAVLARLGAADKKMGDAYRTASEKFFIAEKKLNDPAISLHDAQNTLRIMMTENDIRIRLHELQVKLEENPRYKITCSTTVIAAGP